MEVNLYNAPLTNDRLAGMLGLILRKYGDGFIDINEKNIIAISYVKELAKKIEEKGIKIVPSIEDTFKGRVKIGDFVKLSASVIQLANDKDIYPIDSSSLLWVQGVIANTTYEKTTKFGRKALLERAISGDRGAFLDIHVGSDPYFQTVNMTVLEPLYRLKELIGKESELYRRMLKIASDEFEKFYEITYGVKKYSKIYEMEAKFTDEVMQKSKDTRDEGTLDKYSTFQLNIDGKTIMARAWSAALFSEDVFKELARRRMEKMKETISIEEVTTLMENKVSSKFQENSTEGKTIASNFKKSANELIESIDNTAKILIADPMNDKQSSIRILEDKIKTKSSEARQMQRPSRVGRFFNRRGWNADKERQYQQIQGEIITASFDISTLKNDFEELKSKYERVSQSKQRLFNEVVDKAKKVTDAGVSMTDKHFRLENYVERNIKKGVKKYEFKKRLHNASKAGKNWRTKIDEMKTMSDKNTLLKNSVVEETDVDRFLSKIER